MQLSNPELAAIIAAKHQAPELIAITEKIVGCECAYFLKAKKSYYAALECKAFSEQEKNHEMKYAALFANATLVKECESYCYRALAHFNRFNHGLTPDQPIYDYLIEYLT